ncbi:hypothetical protein BDZ91DRAFT_161402 [Kalaharituber pfeilii]|nr:hypothetical protein BDZ91DRAFT_161402 [Kalaharituber pfeilii]
MLLSTTLPFLFLFQFLPLPLPLRGCPGRVLNLYYSVNDPTQDAMPHGCLKRPAYKQILRCNIAQKLLPTPQLSHQQYWKDTMPNAYRHPLQFPPQKKVNIKSSLNTLWICWIDHPRMRSPWPAVDMITILTLHHHHPCRIGCYLRPPEATDQASSVSNLAR